MSTKHEAEEVWIVEWQDPVTEYWMPETVHDTKGDAEDYISESEEVEKYRIRRYVPQDE